MSDQAVQFVESTGIDVKTAVATAILAVNDLFGKEQINNILLEEVDFAELPPRWKVTIGYDRPKTHAQGGPLSAALALASNSYERVYRVVSIDAASGKVRSIKMR